MQKKLLFPLLMVILFACNTAIYAQNEVIKKPSDEAVEWFNKNEWLNGLNLKPGKPVDINELYQQYQANKIYWQKAMDFLKNNDLNQLEAGNYAIERNLVFATVTKGLTQNIENTNWESHRKYIELMVIISGKENIGIADISKATAINKYDETKDAINYKAEGEMYTARPGYYFIFFNNDVVRPNISEGRNKMVKKIIIRIRAAN